MIERVRGGLGTLALALCLNVALAAAIISLAFFPSSLYGPPPEQLDYPVLLLLAYPLVNTAAWLGTRRRRVGVLFAQGVLFFNYLLASVGFLFLLASCAEQGLSAAEALFSVIIVTPPLLNAALLRIAFRCRTISSVQGAGDRLQEARS